jgi:hypothetical protein
VQHSIVVLCTHAVLHMRQNLTQQSNSLGSQHAACLTACPAVQVYCQMHGVTAHQAK